MPEVRRQSVDDQLAYLRKGAVEIIPEAEFRAKLENSAKTGKPLRVYLGIDPTAPDLHLGHTVVIRKLKHFQDLGHTAIFLIGDFSAMIGDPTGQSETRPPLSREQVDANAKTYLAQVFKILDPQKTEVRYNSEWLGKLSSYEMVKLCGKYSLARMLEREDFRSRLDKNLPISVHELLYPLLTALDAVQLQSDVELGATEQKFNLLVHRAIQREYGLAGQAILTMPILVGLDGAKKMSKSLGNYVGITESPNEMFGKLMSISDDLMWSYYELVTDFAEPVIVRLKEEVRTGVLHPMDAKMQLAHNVIAGFHGEAAARSAAAEFQRVFRNRQAPEEIYEIHLQAGDYPLLRILTEHGLAKSRSEAERLIKQGAVEWNKTIIRDVAFVVQVSQASPPDHWILKVGKKRFLKFYTR
ncbi:MAG TPA: tyrosine--tRNA ligase [Candidatus Acidoferrales bacterium]|nr:tyrosine--tRNA ligase [Candidatus Acidoferrales bacterium]